MRSEYSSGPGKSYSHSDYDTFNWRWCLWWAWALSSLHVTIIIIIMSNNGTIIIMIIKQFECHAIASSRVVSASPLFPVCRSCRARWLGLGECTISHGVAWNGHNHNRKCVYVAPVLVCYYYSCRFLFGRLGFAIVSAADDWPSLLGILTNTLRISWLRMLCFRLQNIYRKLRCEFGISLLLFFFLLSRSFVSMAFACLLTRSWYRQNDKIDWTLYWMRALNESIRRFNYVYLIVR